MAFARSPLERQVCIYRPVTRAIRPAAEAFSEFLLQWLPAGDRLIGRAGEDPAAAGVHEARCCQHFYWSAMATC